MQSACCRFLEGAIRGMLRTSPSTMTENHVGVKYKMEVT